MKAATLWLLMTIIAMAGPSLSQGEHDHGDGQTAGSHVDRIELELTDLAGTVLSVPANAKVTVVNFWATWCVPCRHEIPALRDIHEKFQDDEVAVVGLSVDMDETVLRFWVAEKELPYQIAMVSDSLRNELNVEEIPQTFVLDSTGRVTAFHFGVFDTDDLRNDIRRTVAAEAER